MREIVHRVWGKIPRDVSEHRTVRYVLTEEPCTSMWFIHWVGDEKFFRYFLVVFRRTYFHIFHANPLVTHNFRQTPFPHSMDRWMNKASTNNIVLFLLGSYHFFFSFGIHLSRNYHTSNHVCAWVGARWMSYRQDANQNFALVFVFSSSFFILLDSCN